MSPINTTAVLTAKPEAADEVQTILSTLAAATHGEAGCLLYSLQRGVEDRHVFVTVEKWTSLDDLHQHLASAHVAAALARAGDLLSEPPQIIATAEIAAGDPAKNTY